MDALDKPESNDTLILFVQHASRPRADVNWKSFASDPLWQQAARASRIDAKLLARPRDRVYLKALDFSPLK